jgi:hypothetical protein
MSISVNSRRNLVMPRPIVINRMFPALTWPRNVFWSIPSRRAVSLKGRLTRLANARSSSSGTLIITVTGPRSAKFRVNRFLARSQVAVARSPGWAGLQWLIWGPIATMAPPRIGGYEKRQEASARKKELGSVVYKRKNTCNRRCAPSPLKAHRCVHCKKEMCVPKIRFRWSCSCSPACTCSCCRMPPIGAASDAPADRSEPQRIG